ncbi:MAG TPA: hypothetical protein DCM86_13445 [Verrucomicrobiales bacterium]|nr:hypothetical protein [Verrucomicrobiales bacterium]
MLLALVTLEHGPTELTPALIPSLALAQPQLSTYMTMHSPHNALALNDTSFSSTAAHPAPSTPSSQFGTNTVSP